MAFPYGLLVGNGGYVETTLTPTAYENGAYIFNVSLSSANNTPYVLVITYEIDNITINGVLYNAKENSIYPFTLASQNFTISVTCAEKENFTIKLWKLTNIVKNLNVERIGILARPHSLFILDNEEIYIGRTGLYEVTYPVLSLSMITSDNYIVDYKTGG